eukprot:3466623-Rhodomonas_salina.1
MGRRRGRARQHPAGKPGGAAAGGGDPRGGAGNGELLAALRREPLHAPRGPLRLPPLPRLRRRVRLVMDACVSAPTQTHAHANCWPEGPCAATLITWLLVP